MTTTRSRIRIGHASGRFDVLVALMAAYFAALIRRHRLDVLTTTECQGWRYARATRKAVGKAYRVQRHGEHLTITRRAIVEALRPGRTLFVNNIRRLASWKQMRPSVFRYRIHGVIVRVVVVHGPASIQEGHDWNDDDQPEQVRNARIGWRRVGDNMQAYQDRHPDHVQILTYDGNLALELAKWINWFEDTIGSDEHPAPSVWRKARLIGDTHGDRTIDGAQRMGPARFHACTVSDVPRPRKLDHKALVFSVDLLRSESA